MTWLYYLLEANLYLIIFYGFYRLCLHQETFYGLNRGYLICSSIFSFLIPLLQVGNFNQLIYGNRRLNLIYINPRLENIQSDKFNLTSIEDLAPIFYLVIVFLLVVKLAVSLYKIIALATTARRETSGNVIYIELTSSIPAFSFFNLLFINPLSKEKHTILKHEMVHIRQKHSLDILFFELLRILNWFNPVVWMIQKDIRLIHEYIADDITTDADVQKHEYAMFLIQNSFGVPLNQLTNQIFNKSILKKRIMMLNKKRSAGWARLKMLLVLPVVGGMLFASTVAFTKDYTMVDLYPAKNHVVHPQVTFRKAVQDPVIEQVRFFRLNHKFDENAQRVIKYDNRLVVINGNVASEVIVEVEGFDKMVELKGKKATDKYGSKAAYGALVFTGKNIKTLGLAHHIKFPPPIVAKDKKVPPPPPAKPIKFPPPIVTKDQKVPPPPPAEPIKFPPPIVTKDKKTIPPPPPAPGNQ